jgi:diketogulonate reductase-like aldo/keto reductase
MAGKIKTLGYSNFKNRGMERPISIIKSMGDHLNNKHHNTVHKPHYHHDIDSPR